MMHICNQPLDLELSGQVVDWIRPRKSKRRRCFLPAGNFLTNIQIMGWVRLVVLLPHLLSLFL